MLDIVESGSDLHNFISKINSTNSTSLQKNQAIEMLINQTKLEAANFLKEGLRNEVDQKLFIQNMIVKTWKNSGFINADNYHEFAKITVYHEDVPKGFLFTKKTIGKSMNAINKYSREYFQPDDYSDYQYNLCDSACLAAEMRDFVIAHNLYYEEKAREEKDNKIKSIKQAINEKYKQKIQAERAAKRRQEQERIKQDIRNQYRARQRAGVSKTSSGAGNILSAADSLRLGGNYAYGVAFGKQLSAILRPYRNQSAALTKNDGNKSVSLFFDGLLEETTSNSPKFSERVKASPAGYGDYNHTAWGAWSGGQNTRYDLSGSLNNFFFLKCPDNCEIEIGGDFSSRSLVGNIQGGYWVYGQRPGIADIPKSGSARYVGQLMGDFWTVDNKSSITRERGSITGDIKMAVTFQDGNNSIFGSLNLKRSGADWANASFNTLNARSAPNAKFRSSDHFSTSLNTKSGNGRLTGSFFGANAAEAGGNFYLSKREGADRGSVIGVFRAKNVGNVVGNISDADRLKLLSGNYAVATYNGGYGFGTFLNQGSPYNLPLRSGSSSSLTLRFLGLKESIPNSDTAKGNTLIPSDRINVHTRDYGDYSYVAWGAWSSGQNTRIRPFDPETFPWWESVLGGHWIYGKKLGRADIPRSGSAHYIGQVKGFYDSNPYPAEMNSITGDINMAVTFRDSNFSLSGVMNLDRNGEDWGTARFNDPNATTGYETSQFQFGARLSVDGYSDSDDVVKYSYINGSFFGANAAEVGGTFSIHRPTRNFTAESVHGVYRAKKQ